LSSVNDAEKELRENGSERKKNSCELQESMIMMK